MSLTQTVDSTRRIVVNVASETQVVTSRAQFGLTRLYQAIIDADATTYRIFENWDDAVAWLEAHAEN